MLFLKLGRLLPLNESEGRLFQMEEVRGKNALPHCAVLVRRASTQCECIIREALVSRLETRGPGMEW